MGEALHKAACGGHEGIVSDLLEGGAPVDAKDTLSMMTPLHCCAAEGGRTEMVQLLLLKGADKDAMDEEGRTPLFLAVENENLATARTLMAAGADVTLRCGPDERSVLHAAAEDGYFEISFLREVIKHGAGVNAVDENEVTPLHLAATRFDMSAIVALVEAGANIEARSWNGDRPLSFAARHSALETSLALLKHGAHVNSQNNGLQTPLHIAASKAGTDGVAEVVDTLLRSGADETIVDENGKTAVDVVGIDTEVDGMYEEPELVLKLLVNAPADRVWRRRGYLVLCRAHPVRVHLKQEASSIKAGTQLSARSGAKLAREKTSRSVGAERGSFIVDQGSIEDWTDAVARVLGLQEEGIFRSIVGYL